MRIASIPLAVTATSLVTATLQLPAVGEIDIVFPRNETYGVVSPFPVIIAFRNPQVWLDFVTTFSWFVSCKNESLHGTQDIRGNTSNTYGSETFYATWGITSTDEAMGVERNTDFARLWPRSALYDVCTLEWSFGYHQTCSRGDQDVKNKLGSGKGTVVFTLKPGAEAPQDAIVAYRGCPVGGIARNISDLPTETCPHLSEEDPSVSPCEVDVQTVASSLAAKVEATTTFLGSTAAGGTHAPEITGSNGKGGRDKDGSAIVTSVSKGAALAAVIAAGFGAF